MASILGKILKYGVPTAVAAPGLAVTTGQVKFSDMVPASVSKFVSDMKENFEYAANPQKLAEEANPAAKIFQKLATKAEFQTDAGKAKLANITGDKRFMSSLNDAIKNDPSIATGIVNASMPGNTNSFFNPTKMVDSLQDRTTRRTMSKVLDAVAKSPDDQFNFTYLENVGKAAEAANAKDAKKEDRTKLRTLLAEAGVKDIRLEFAENPWGMLKEAFKNPQQFFQMLPELFGFQNLQKEGLSELSGGVGFIVDFFTGNKQDREAAGRIYNAVSTKLESSYDRISGNADKRNALYDRGQEILQQYSADTPSRERTGGWKTAADNSNDAGTNLVGGSRIQASAVCSSFNPCATGADLSGYKPPTTPVADNSDFKMQPARFGLSGPAALSA